jgi:hypothetical protein
MRALEIMERIRENDITVTNPDIITLLIAGKYHWASRDARKERQWSDVFKNISVMIFDEYHVYDEEEISKIISFLVLSRATGNDHIKFIFASATPNHKILDLLRERGFSCREVTETMYADRFNDRDFRASKGRIDLTFTSKEINDSIPQEIPPRGRTLFLFDHIIGLEKGIARLNGAGVSDFDEYSGFETRAAEKKVHTGQEKFVMATSAAEQGLNMEVDIAHIEPGLYLQNFWQRFGRAARRGKDGMIIVHMPLEMVQHLPETIAGYEALGETMNALMRDRDTYASRIKDSMGAFLFLVWKKSGNSALRAQVESAGRTLNKFGEFRAFDRGIMEVSNNGSDYADPDDISDLEAWWASYMQSFGWFRGQSTSVEVTLPRALTKRTEADIRWLKQFCDCRSILDGERTIYEITSIHDAPRNIDLKYAAPGGSLTINGKVMNNRETLRREWLDHLGEFFDQAFDDEGDGSSSIEAVRRLLPAVLKPLHPDLLRPEGVEAVVDDLFL